MGWRDFIRGHRYEVVLKGNEKDPVWWFQIENSNDRYIVIDDWEEVGDKVVIKVAPIHEKDIEAWQSGLKETKALAEALSKTKQDYYTLLASGKRQSIEDAVRMLEPYLAELEDLLGISIRVKQEEKKESEQADQSQI